MNAISQNLPNFRDFDGLSMGSGKFYASQINQITTSVENSKDITIMTAEGDKVTISSDFQSKSQYTTYNSLARVSNMSLNIGGNSFSINSSSEFSMLVEGDLNEQELKDIQKAMKTIDKIMQSTLSGNLKNAMAMVNKVGNLESIASFEAGMQSNKTVIVEQALMMVSEGTPEGAAEGNVEGSISDQGLLKPAADQIMGVIDQSGLKPSKFIKPLDRYISEHFFDKSSTEDHKYQKHPEMGRRIRSELLERIKQLDEAKEEIPESKTVNEDMPEIAEKVVPLQDEFTNMETEASILQV